ncbi:hypothetical protein [Nocardia otitidiscaviarum]|uniref:hypothetical protein n=1 Tax=Nocardia otitidiscaviarum TaxID=1823 RepID=UPI0018962DAE|nr:hypothetical protein [Nocardia otitidiscaviarum]MBF6180866.1 hypothetical protein [Nocardia otitidiscaviarum]
MTEYISPRALQLAGCDFTGPMNPLEAREAQALHRDCDPAICTTASRAAAIQTAAPPSRSAPPSY